MSHIFTGKGKKNIIDIVREELKKQHPNKSDNEIEHAIELATEKTMEFTFKKVLDLMNEKLEEEEQ